MQEELEREELEKEVKPVEKKAYRWPAYGKNIKQFEIWTVEWRNNPNDVKHAVIVQGNALNEADPMTFLVCPLSKCYPYRKHWFLRQYIDVEDKGRYTILVDNITTISAQALLDRIDILKLEEQQRIRRNISLILGFNI